jgi:hypothetical protein
MFCTLHRLRLGAIALLIAVMFAGMPLAPALAQGDPTPTPAEDAPTGQLTVNVTACTRDDQPEGTISVVAAGETDGLECQPGDSASLSIDGGDPVTVANGDTIELTAGSHTVTETTQGASLTIEISEGAETVIEVTTAVAPAGNATETPEAATAQSGPNTVRVVAHLCRAGITRDAFAADRPWTDDVRDCPALTLPDNYGDVPADVVTANDPDNPLPFDASLAYDAADAAAIVALADATFTPGKVCESDFGQNLNGVANDDRCWDLSGYQVDDVVPGQVTVSVDTLPEGYTFGGATLDGGATIATTDPDAATTTIDTSATGDAVVHLFFVPEPATNEITVISHLCGTGIDSRRTFDAIGDHWAKLNACPSIVRTGDAPAPDSVTAGPMDFTVEVQPLGGTAKQLADATFDQRKVCEADLPVDINGNPNDNVCLDLSQYDFADVTQGAVTIRANKQLPPDSIFLGISTLPNSGDDAAVTGVGTSGTIKLDTTSDGHVTIHVFYGPQPPATAVPPTATATPTKAPTKVATKTPTPAGPTKTPTKTATPAPTRTPGGPTETPAATNTPAPKAGSVQIFKFWCDGDESLTRINALAPGQDASRSDLGDATCQSGNSDFILFDGSGNQLQTVSVPAIGVLMVDNLPAGSYSIRDTRSSASGRFEIRAGTVTKVISLHYQAVEEIPDAPIVPTVDLGDDGNPPDIEDTLPVDDEGDFPFDGPVAIPDSSDPFTVVDDPEAEVRVESVDSFDELPGVGIGQGQSGSGSPLMWFAALTGVVTLLGGARLWSRRSVRHRS